MIPKFKAFIKTTKQLEDVVLIHLKSHLVKVASGKWYDFEDIVLMQSTGLNDKNGVEIFEGDIVKYSDYEYSFTGIVTQDTVTCWWIKGIEPDDNFSFDDVTDYNDYTCDAEVIGNVHENPELLEAT